MTELSARIHDFNRVTNYVIDRKPPTSVRCQAMATKPKTLPKLTPSKKVQLRATPEDLSIIEFGMRKHGLDMSQIIRMALRRFAEAEGIRA